MAQHLAPYRHKNGSNCWTKDCSRGNHPRPGTIEWSNLSLGEQIKHNKGILEEKKIADGKQIKHEQVVNWKTYGFQHPWAPRHHKKDYSQYSKEKQQQLISEYSAKQIQALTYYTSFASTQINKHLNANAEYANPEETTWYRPELEFEKYRDGAKRGQIFGVAPGSTKRPKLTKEQVEEMISELDSVLNSTHSDKAKVLYRGISFRKHLGLEPDSDIHDYVDKNFGLGSTIEFKGYTSTTTQAPLAASWASPKAISSPRMTEGIFIEILTNKGLHTSPITAAPTRAMESETLLPRNTKWKVVAVHKERTLTLQSDETSMVENPITNLQSYN